MKSDRKLFHHVLIDLGRYAHLLVDAVLLPQVDSGCGGHVGGHVECDLDHGPADWHRVHLAHHELHDPHIPDADSGPG